MGEKSFVIGIDTGGTFTDTVIVDEAGNIAMGKALTNYKDLKTGVMQSLADAAAKIELSVEEVLEKTVFVGHGTTLGTNAVINRKFGKIGLLTTKGLEDTSLIMRAGARTDGLSEAEVRHQAVCFKPEPLIPKSLIKGITERVDCFGEEVLPLNEDLAKRLIEELMEEGVEAIAISLLWSFLNPRHEKLLKKMVSERDPGIYLSVSHEVAPRIREYARTMTVIIDACIGKLMREYINSLNKEMENRGLRYPISIMHAYGGVTSSATARPVSTIESGPVGGVIGCKYLGDIMGYKNIVTTDVGGTSFDVSVLVNGEWSFAKESIMMRFRVAIPIIKISCIGAGGGTRARFDPIAGGLKVGPESAGSDPGPVCYDIGGMDPTVTDADLILGYLNPDYFLEGKMQLNKEKAVKLTEEKIANPLGIGAVEAAAGIYDIVNSYMTDNLRQAVIEKGYDPRDFVLFAYGGNGPMHVASYAKELGVKKAIIPPQASAFSAFGIASSDFVRIYNHTEIHPMPADPFKVTELFENMEKVAIEDMLKEGFKSKQVDLVRELEMRYTRQVHEVPITVKPGKLDVAGMSLIADDWEKRYEEIYGKGSGFREAGIQIVTFRITATSRVIKPQIKKMDKKADETPDSALKETRKAFFRKYDDFVDTKIFDYQKLRYGNVIEGPAIIEAPTTTIVVLPDITATVDEYMNVVLNWEQ